MIQQVEKQHLYQYFNIKVIQNRTETSQRQSIVTTICPGVHTYNQNQLNLICATYSSWEQQKKKKFFKGHMENRDQLQKGCHQLIADSAKNLEAVDLGNEPQNSSNTEKKVAIF